MEEALRALFLADTGLSALVGTRVFWAHRPQRKADLPAIILHRVAGRRDMHFEGPSGLVESTVQADIYGDTYEAAKTAARALGDVVNGFAGAHSGTVFQRIAIEAERDTSETGGARQQLFRTSLDLSIWHDE